MTFTDKCEEFLGERSGGRAFLTPSCTSSLELSVRLLKIGVGDEVILPSFAYCSAANAVILAGGMPVFVDIDPETLNIDHKLVWDAITPRTKAVITIHYAGVDPGIPTETIPVIEDAAQSVGIYKFRGALGCMSFHRTKNVQCGEGGAWFVPSPGRVEEAQFLRHCGLSFFKNAMKYDWECVGTHGIMSEYAASHLWTELQRVDEITSQRTKIWTIYHDGIIAEKKASHIGNGHIFWFLEDSYDKRERLIQVAKDRAIRLTSHYTPLHSTGPGQIYGRIHVDCPVSTEVSQRIVRLPMNVGEMEAYRVVSEINELRGKTV